MTKLDKKRQTAINSFQVTQPNDELETVGEILTLSMFGEYCPGNSLRGYALLELISHPTNYRIHSIIQQGQVIILSENNS